MEQENKEKRVNFVDYGSTQRPMVLLKDSDTLFSLNNKCHAELNYIIINAGCGLQNPYQTRMEGREQMKKLVSLLKEHHFSYKPLYGYSQIKDSDEMVIEKAYIVYSCDNNHIQKNTEKLFDFGKLLCKEFGCDSFLYEHVDKSAELINGKGDVITKIGTALEHEQIIYNYFKNVIKCNETVEVYVNPSPNSYQEGHMRWASMELNDWGRTYFKDRGIDITKSSKK